MLHAARRVALIAAVALTGLAVGRAAPAHGASFTVNATHDAVDAAPGDGVCADADGACTLRAAVEETNALPGADAIAAPAGTYTLTPLPGAGGLIVKDDLEISGAGAGVTVIRTTNPETEMVASVLDLRCSNRRFDIKISGATIRSGLAEGGGGINNCGHSLSLRGVAVGDNDGNSLYGGGLRTDGGTAVIEDSVFYNNRAQRGGAIDSVGGLTLTNVTISGNTTNDWGGALYSEGEATLTNVSVVGNMTAGDRVGGILGKFELKNTLLSGNSNLGNCGGSISSLGHNLSSDASCDFSGPGDINGADPQVTGLQNNGGPTLTHGLYSSSPAIDAGDSNGCPATDQRGVTRPQGAGCDIGAYEYVLPVPPPPTEPPTETEPPPPVDTATAGPTPRPALRAILSPSPSPSPAAAASASARRPRGTPVFTAAAAVLIDAPSVEEDSGGGLSIVASGLRAAGVLGLLGSAAGGGWYWYRLRRKHRQ